MRRPLVIALVLMGGGAVAAGTLLPNRNRECEQARAANLPNAEEVCARAGSSSRGSPGSHAYWGSTYWGGGSRTTTAAAVGAGMAASKSASAGVAGSGGGSVSRGGFGASGHGFSSSGGG